LTGSFTKADIRENPAAEVADSVETPSSYSADFAVTVKILDVKTASYKFEIESAASGYGKDAEMAAYNALHFLAEGIATQVEQLLTVTAYVTDVKKGNIKIDAGRKNGVREGMIFDLYDNNTEAADSLSVSTKAGNLTGYLQIVSVKEKYATGRLVSGSGNVKKGYFAYETKGKIGGQPRILNKTFQGVTVNLGEEDGVEYGHFYDVKLENTDDKAYTNMQNFARIVVTSVSPTYSSAKIIKGFYKVKPGMSIIDGAAYKPYFHFAVTSGIFISPPSRAKYVSSPLLIPYTVI
jgi:hypothetical protein